MSVASTDREPNRWAVLALLSVAQLMVVLDATIVTIAIPSAQEALHFSTESRQWIVTAYALAFGSLLLLGGKLGDLFGRKWTLVAGLVGFSIASAIGGLAQSFGVSGRPNAPGGFGALLAPSALGLLTVTFEGSPDRPTAFGIFGAIAGGGASLGLILGGALTQVLSWRWCLYVNLVIAVPTTMVALRLLVNHRLRSGIRSTYPGSHLGARPLRAGLRVLQRRDPLLECNGHDRGTRRQPGAPDGFRADRAPSQVSAAAPAHHLGPARGGAYTTIALAGAGVFAVFLFLTYFLQQQLGLSPLPPDWRSSADRRSGGHLDHGADPRDPTHRGQAPGTRWNDTRGDRDVPVHAPDARLQLRQHVLPGLLILGVGMGCIFAPAFSTATLGVEGREAGVASAMVNTSQQVGGSVGTSLLSTIFASAVASYTVSHLHTAGLANAAAVHGYTTAFWWAVGIFALGSSSRS